MAAVREEITLEEKQAAAVRRSDGWARFWKQLPAALAVPVALAYAVYVLAPAAGIYHDDGVYLATAKSLAEGKGYRIQSLPSEMEQNKYPILFPALLAGLWKVFPDFPSHAWVFHALPAVGIWMVAAIVILLGRRHGLSEATSRWAALAWVAAPASLFYGTLVMPESTFTVCCLGSIMLLESACSKEGRGSLIAAALAGALTAASILLRSLGATLVPMALYLAWKRKWRAAATFLLTSTVLALPWMVHTMTQPVSADPVERYYTKLNYVEGNLFALKSAEQVRDVLLRNAIMQLSSPQRLFGLGSGVSGAVLGFLLSLLALAGLAAAVKGEGSLTGLWTILYSGAVLLWLWPPDRYLIPVLPCLILFAAAPMERLIRGGGTRKLLCCGLTGLCGLLVGWTDSRIVLETHQKQWASPRPGLSEDWAKMQGALIWMSKNTPADAVIGANLDPMVFLYTGRKSIRLFNYNQFDLLYSSDPKRRPLGDSEDLRRHLLKHRIGYLLLTPMPTFWEGQYLLANVAELQQRFPSALQPVAGFSEAGYSLLQVRSDALQQPLSGLPLPGVFIPHQPRSTHP